MIVSGDAESIPPPSAEGSVVSVGVFDGVHLGHQAILAANIARARELGARPTVLTFSGHPKELLLGRAPRTLTTIQHRLALFQRAGIEHTVVLRFDAALRATPVEDFASEWLVRRLSARCLVLGFDNKFGRNREGTPERLAALGYDVRVVPKVMVDERAVSSTAIREAVELGDLGGAERMLGRRVSVFGEVVHGDELGRRLGFPTANLDLHHELHPPPGVYACFARRLGPGGSLEVRPRHAAVCNIGFRPTVRGTPAERATVEVHLIGFEGDLYGEALELEFVLPLRDEQRFPDLAALGAQIARDVQRAKVLLERSPESSSPGAPEPSNPGAPV